MTPLVIFVVIVALILAARELAARRRERVLREELETVRSQLKESDHLVNVGQLVSGLVQDLKSPLQGMMGNAEVLSAAGPGDAQSAHELKQLRDNVTRATGIVRNLLAFTETTQLDRRWDDLNAIVKRSIQQYRSAGPNDGIVFQGTARLQLVYVDGRQIERVLLTLLSHAAPGRTDGTGDISVTTRRVSTPTDRMVIDIDDPRAADGDEVGALSGDLDACRRVLEAHGGLLEVERQGGAGVRFHLEFPITELVEKQAT